MKPMEKFINYLPLLEEIEFIGLAKILSVPLLDDEGGLIGFTDLVEQMVVNFSKLPRTNRRELLKILKAATKDRTLETMKKSYVEDAADPSEVKTINETED